MIQTGEIKISSHEKSKLTGILTSWTGSPKGVGFDTESLKGEGAMINIVEKTSKKGRPYMDITSITPVMQGMEAQVPQPSQFNIPGKSDISLQNAQNQQVVQNNITPTVTTQQTIDQPQSVSQQISNTAQQAQMFSAPAPAPF
jgi:hypothetical protein